jgi:transposase
MRYVSKLSIAQEEALQRRWRTARSHRERQRAHAVLLSAKGYRLEECAEVLGVDRDAISRWLDRWEEGGVEALAEGARPGRPRALDEAQQAEVAAAAAANPASPRRELAKRGR